MKNQEILDDELLHNGKEVIDKRTKKPQQRALIYLVIMLIIGCGFAYYQYKETLLNPNFVDFFTISIEITIACILISLILELFRFLVRKLRKKQLDTITLLNPFWFQIIEGAFAIWILFKIVKIIFISLFGLI